MARTTRRPRVLAAALVALAVGGGGAVLWTVREPRPLFADGFDAFDPARWVVTGDGDFAERAVDVFAPDAARGARLRLRGATQGTRDDTVKFLGVRSAAPVLRGADSKVKVEVDWNGQANGSYLSADVVVSPHRTDGNPLMTGDWVMASYVGVPPGRNARLVVAASVDGRRRTLYAEGWPEQRREGRAVSRQGLELRIRGDVIEVLENARTVFRGQAAVPGLDRAFLYLQMSTHSNYPSRELFFDDVAVSSG